MRQLSIWFLSLFCLIGPSRLGAAERIPQDERKKTRLPGPPRQTKDLKPARPSFADATVPPVSGQPARKMRNGKELDDFLPKVRDRWPEIVFEKDGKKVVYTATLKTSLGDIDLDFFPEVAPNHVRNFVILSELGFYDGLIIHRVKPKFVIQGGCPFGTGEGDPGYCLKQEFNDRAHLRGALSMPREGHINDSGGCQFFICVDDVTQLDRKYTVFGRVSNGLDVVDKIVAVRRHPNDKPIEDVVIKEVVLKVDGKVQNKPGQKDKKRG